MTGLRLYLLGPPRIERDGAPVGVDTAKAIALLAYLVLTETSQRRETLIGLLWPESDQSGARGNLRRTLSALNTALGGHWLDADREVIDLDRSAGLWIDVEEFRRLLSASRAHGHAASETCSDCLASLVGATALYRDDFMAGWLVAV